MKKLIFILLCFINLYCIAQTCSTSNTSGCVCPAGATECDLLPDIVLSRDLLLDPAENPEYAPTPDGPGRVGVSVGTPNIGHGTFEVHATTRYVCGIDTFYGTSPGTCPDSSQPKQILIQRIYQKSSTATVSYYDRDAGTMTYHPEHGHMHVDDWGIYSLRIPTTEPDPLTWPIVGDGAKLGFCLMDFGSCGDAIYVGYCRDDMDAILVDSDFPNFGLGGGSYGCFAGIQGISSGYLDIYHYSLDGMTFDLTEGVCNGDYAVVVEVDPHNYFLEEREDNNVMWVPYTLTEQLTSASATISADGPLSFCGGNDVTLAVNPIGSTYSWSNGATGSSITVNESGTYTCTITTVCGEVTSPPVNVTVAYDPAPEANSAGIVCVNGSATLSVTAPVSGETYNWYDVADGGSVIDTGITYNTPILTTTTSFWVSKITITSGIMGNVGPSNPAAVGTGGYATSGPPHYLIFDVLTPIVLQSVKVTVASAATQDIVLQGPTGAAITTYTATLVAGENIVPLNFSIPENSNYRLLGASIFYRNNEGASYPYTMTDHVSITGNDVGPNYYYYFYDWQVQGPDMICESDRAEVIASVDPGCTGFTDVDIANISIYPNPANLFVSLLFATSDFRNIDVYNTQGQLLVSDICNLRNCQININNLSKGIYIIKASNGTIISTGKFTKI